MFRLINRRFFSLKMESPQTLTNKQQVYDFLKQHNVAYKVYEHAEAKTVQEIIDSVGKFEHSPFIKNLVNSDKKKRHFYVMADNNTKVGKRFWKTVGTAGGSIRWAKPETLSEHLKVSAGEVNPFALGNDSSNAFPKILIDENLKGAEYWAVHPMDNSVSVEFLASDLERVITEVFKKEVVYVALEDAKHPEPVKGKNKGKKQKKQKKAKGNEKGETKLKMSKDKESQFGDWYSEVIKKGGMIEYYDVSGCYILKPASYYVWETVQKYLDGRFGSLGVQNVYFPMFVKKKHLESEKDHLEGFEAEVAWVTHSGKSKLAEPIAIRPTSETIMYPVFKNWLTSHRDLPMLYNQWTNIVRWEFKHPTPFIRTREFLWQEGHTVHADNDECSKFVKSILDIYADCYSEVLAVPVIQGVKSEIEKFAGADYTTTCETFIAEAGRSVQACTSHNLGQNFAKIFKLSFEDKNQANSIPWQASWGFTTRSIGIMIMVHSDNKGLVLPPKVATTQAVIVPITFSDKTAGEVTAKCLEVQAQLKGAGVRVIYDDRDNYKPGWKFNDWELKGIPLRIEIGPKDIAKQQVKLVRRVDGKKSFVAEADLLEQVALTMEDIHATMLKTATEKLLSKRAQATDWGTFMDELNQMKYIETPWCTAPSCEEDVKTKSAEDSDESSGLSGKAKTLCMPFEQEDLKEGAYCFNCGEPAKKYVIWGRSY